MNAWGTSLLAEKDMFGSMVLVALPEGLTAPPEKIRGGGGGGGGGESGEGGSGGLCLDSSSADVVQNALYHKFKVEVSIQKYWYIQSFAS